MKSSKIIAHIAGRNQVDRYFLDVLMHLYGKIDLLVYTDNYSIDGTALLAAKVGGQVRRTREVIEDDKTMREIAWEHLALHASPGDWILTIEPEERFGASVEAVRAAADQSINPAVSVLQYWMWNPEYFRLDGFWMPHFEPRMFRYHRFAEFEHDLFPTYVREWFENDNTLKTDMFIQNLKFVRDEDKLYLYKKYKESHSWLDPIAVESILDSKPQLIDWYS